MPNSYPEIKVVPKAPRFRLVRWFRNRLITGILVALPFLAIIWLFTRLVGIIDGIVWSVVPDALNPNTYIDAPFWFVSLIIAVVVLLALGMFVSNAVGRRVLRAGERVLARVPVISPIYSGIKQILNTVANQKDRAFRDVCLIEYPKAGVWAVGFVTADVSGAPKTQLGEDYLCVFVPTTPNPTSGFLLFVPRADVKLLDMTPEEGAKLIISGGMVTSNEALDDFVPSDPLVPLSDETLAR